mmetsp:Transcript_16050/g.48768  ORF Transcript_16050/g.48768 Transcript_16050/m.48768 type:complete len:141 (-) Transcript_16050:203-625(-)|eukprot:scaffold135106_cov30-Tisochrysis_lutea.AAC.2
MDIASHICLPHLTKLQLAVSLPPHASFGPREAPQVVFPGTLYLRNSRAEKSCWLFRAHIHFLQLCSCARPAFVFYANDPSLRAHHDVSAHAYLNGCDRPVRHLVMHVEPLSRKLKIRLLVPSMRWVAPAASAMIPPQMKH